MKTLPVALLSLALLRAAANAQVGGWPIAEPIPLQSPPAQSVLTVVPSDPVSANLPHRDRKGGGHWDLSISNDRLAVAYTFCSDVACLDHKKFTFPGLTHDAAGRRFLYGKKVVATHDASGTVTIAADVSLATSVEADPGAGVDVVSARLEFGLP